MSKRELYKYPKNQSIYKIVIPVQIHNRMDLVTIHLVSLIQNLVMLAAHSHYFYQKTKLFKTN